jgi:hypothetical protein
LSSAAKFWAKTRENAGQIVARPLTIHVGFGGAQRSVRDDSAIKTKVVYPHLDALQRIALVPDVAFTKRVADGETAMLKSLQGPKHHAPRDAI